MTQVTQGCLGTVENFVCRIIPGSEFWWAVKFGDGVYIPIEISGPHMCVEYGIEGGDLALTFHGPSFTDRLIVQTMKVEDILRSNWVFALEKEAQNFLDERQEEFGLDRWRKLSRKYQILKQTMMSMEEDAAIVNEISTIEDFILGFSGGPAG